MADRFSMFFFSLLSLVFSRGSLKECESSGFLQDFVHFLMDMFFICVLLAKNMKIYSKC